MRRRAESTDGSLLTGRRILARMYKANAVQRVNLFTSWGMAHQLNLVDNKLIYKMYYQHLKLLFSYFETHDLHLNILNFYSKMIFLHLKSSFSCFEMMSCHLGNSFSCCKMTSYHLKFIFFVLR